MKTILALESTIRSTCYTDVYGNEKCIEQEMVGVGGDAASQGLHFFAYVVPLIVVAIIAAHWKIFTKANKPGWASLVPIYNIFVTLKVVQKPGWWTILMFIPIINIFVGIYIVYLLAQVFGRGIGFTLGLIFLPFIFLPILAFGKSTYQPSSATQPMTV